MKSSEYVRCVARLRSMAAEVAIKKRPDYTQENADVLANFKASARDAGITPLQAWIVHFQKQYSAVARHAKNPVGTVSEPIDQRFVDLLNYVELGFAIWAEGKPGFDFREPGEAFLHLIQGGGGAEERHIDKVAEKPTDGKPFWIADSGTDSRGKGEFAATVGG